MEEGREIRMDKLTAFYVGDVVKMKKKHPCGSDEWEVLRTGADIRMKCLGCDHMVLIERPKFARNVKKIIKRIVEEQDADK